MFTVRRLTLFDIFIFGFFLAIISTFVKPYQFGTGDQVEQIAIILRKINPQYLPNDFFVNSTAVFGPRTYYSMLMSTISNEKSLPYIFLALTLFSNFGVALITALTARKLFGSYYITLLSMLFVMVLRPIQLGGATDLYQSWLIPQTLAMPFLLLSVYLYLFSSLRLSFYSIFLAIFIHPTLGLGTGVLILGSRILISLYNRSFPNSQKLDMLLGGSILLCGYLLYQLPTTQAASIPTSEFLSIFAYFRSPHHILPQRMEMGRYVTSLSLLSGFILMYFAWLQKIKMHVVSEKILSMLGLLLSICIGTFFFAEIAPIRFWAIVQPFRFLYLLQWFEFLYLGYFLATYAHSVSKKSFLRKCLYATLGIVILFVSGIGNQPGVVSQLMLSFFGLLVLICIQNVQVSHGAIALMLSTFLGLIFLQPIPFLPTRIANSVSFLKPQITLNDMQGEMADLARFSKIHTPENAIFLTPQFFGEFRLIAQRALVVDFKAIPFQDVGMHEWFQRQQDIFGIQTVTTQSSLEGAYALSYKNLTPEKILMICERYNCSHAILYQETMVPFKTLYETKTYRLVSLK